MKKRFAVIMLLAISSLGACMQDQKPASKHSDEWYVVLDKKAQASPFCIVHKGTNIIPATRYKIVDGPHKTKAEAEEAEKKCKECKDPDATEK